MNEITITWTEEDIQNFAMGKKYERRLTDEAVNAVLYELDRRYNSDIGINWTVIDTIVEEVEEEFNQSEHNDFFVPLSITVQLKNGFDNHVEAEYTFMNVSEEEAIEMAKEEWVDTIEPVISQKETE